MFVQWSACVRRSLLLTTACELASALADGAAAWQVGTALSAHEAQPRAYECTMCARGRGRMHAQCVHEAQPRAMQLASLLASSGVPDGS